jgi:hypothetical protein
MMDHRVRSLVVGVGAVAFVLSATPMRADEEKKTEKRETETEVTEHESPPRVIERREKIEVPSSAKKEHTVKKKEKHEVEEEDED